MNLNEANHKLDSAIEVAKAKRLERTIFDAIAQGFKNIVINVPKSERPEVTVERQELPPITVEVPKIEAPQVTVNVDTSKFKLPAFPAIKVPKPEVTVNFDTSKIKMPKIDFKDLPEYPEFPEEMFVKLKGINQKAPLPVIVMNPSSPGGGSKGKVVSIPLLIEVPKVGQAKIAVTGVAVQLPNKEFVNGVLISALSTNTANIIIGEDGVTTTEDGTGNGYILEPGNTASFAVMNLKRLFINGTANDIISFVGS